MEKKIIKNFNKSRILEVQQNRDPFLMIDYAEEVWRIRAIHTGTGRTLKGTVEAQDIKRIYLHEPPNLEHFEPKTPRERRQAWKEGRLGYNPNPELPKEVTKKRVTPSNKRKKKKPRK